MRQDITIRLPYKDAKKLLGAVQKGTFNKLTRSEADAIAEFAFELECSVMEAE